MWKYGGPCMCGGCRRCLHDQGYNCGDERCARCMEAGVSIEGEIELDDPDEVDPEDEA